MSRMPIKIALYCLTAALCLYGIGIAAVYFHQEAIIFQGVKLPESHVFKFDVPFKEVNIPVDGAHLNALHFEQTNPRGLVFFLHGNGGNLVDWTVGVDYYQKINYDLFIFDYRGYGKSTGRIESQKQLMADVRKMWDFISPQYNHRPIVIYGRSLGTALAVLLAREVPSRLLVLVSPYTSLAAVAREQYRFIPQWVLRYPMQTDAVIGDISTETLILHGSEDAFIPPAHSRRLISIMNAPATLLIIQGADHTNIHQFNDYLDSLASALPQ